MKRYSDASAVRSSNIPSLSDDDEGSRQSSIMSFFVAKPRKKICKRQSPAVLSSETTDGISSDAPNGKAAHVGGPLAANSRTNGSSTHSVKTKRNPQQVFLDMGQKSFGRRTLCQICGMLYDDRLDEDSKHHSSICNEYSRGVPFQAEAARTIVSFGRNASIVEVRPTDSYTLRKKILQVQYIVDKELGFVQADESETTTQRWTYLYILHQRVVGVASAQPLQHGFNLLDNNLDRSTAKQKAVVGIHQIWVHSKFRRQGIASLLVDALREKMVYGLVIPREHVAFSSPTLTGAAFARKYVAGHSSLSGQDSLCPVLVYDCG